MNDSGSLTVMESIEAREASACARRLTGTQASEMARLRSISMHLLIMFILSQLHTASSFRSEPAPKEDPDPTENLCRASEVQEDEFAPTPSGMDGVFQDARLVGSFVLGIAFMHAMEVLKPGRGGTARKFELYPYVL